MSNSTRHRRKWCCAFLTPPLSPEYNTTITKKSEVLSHPQKTQLSRWIHSPGRVSPISDMVSSKNPAVIPTLIAPKVPLSDIMANSKGEYGSSDSFDMILNLKGKNGGESLILELNSKVLGDNSSVFSGLIGNYRRNDLSGGLCRIGVADVENLSVFSETIELMFEGGDICKKLMKIGVFRAIDILEVSASIQFGKGVSSCLKYLEAVPWTEEEEKKLKELFPKLNIEDATKTTYILERLYNVNLIDSQHTLAKQLIWFVTSSKDTYARNEMKSLVKGLLCKSSIYDINKEDMHNVCESCVVSLVSLFEEASCSVVAAQELKNEKNKKPLVERIAKQVDNINWMLEILFNHQMAEEFVDLWVNQGALIEMWETASPMVRYELSRVTSFLFIGMGSRRLHCQLETRLSFVLVWFRPLLLDFGWLQRCRKGLDMRTLEEAIGQILLTLPLKEQHQLFTNWFQCFSNNGSECPNLSKAFQIWWRRCSVRGSGAIVPR